MQRVFGLNAGSTLPSASLPESQRQPPSFPLPQPPRLLLPSHPPSRADHWKLLVINKGRALEIQGRQLQRVNKILRLLESVFVLRGHSENHFRRALFLLAD